MIFEKLPKELQRRIFALTEDAEFQERFRTDPELDRIDQLKKHKQLKIKLLQALVLGGFSINGRFYRCPSPAALSFLWCMKNPLVFGGDRQPDVPDFEVFIWLEQDPEAIERMADDVLRLSKAWCEEHDVDLEAVAEALPEIMRLCFQPFRALPAASGGQIDLGPEWLAAICSKAAVASGQPVEKIMRGPMTAAAQYFVEYVRANSIKPLTPASDQDLLLAEDCRCCQLICQYLAQKGFMPKEKIADYVDLMIYKPVVNNAGAQKINP